VTAGGLAKVLGVSESTVRRDLRALAAAGSIEQAYGEATLPRRTDWSFQAKAKLNKEAKKVVGRLAAEQISDGDQVFIDSGTTCFEMTGVLKTRSGVSVIVNSARLALELDSSRLEVILLGGQYRPHRMDTVGPVAMSALEHLHGYTAFIGADGLSTKFGLTASDIASAHLFGLAVRNARRTVLVVDHTKFQTTSLREIANWDSIDTVVTDSPPPPAWREFLSSKSIGVLYPDGGGSPGGTGAD